MQFLFMGDWEDYMVRMQRSMVPDNRVLLHLLQASGYVWTRSCSVDGSVGNEPIPLGSSFLKFLPHSKHCSFNNSRCAFFRKMKL